MSKKKPASYVIVGTGSAGCVLANRLSENRKQLIEMSMNKQPQTEVCLFNRSDHDVFREYPAPFSRNSHAFVMRYA